MSAIDRFFGGPPLRTILWLAFLSVVVGFVLNTLGLHPLSLVSGILNAIEDLVDWVSRLGLGAFRSVGNWLIYGAIIVIPVWIVLRIMAVGRGR